MVACVGIGLLLTVAAGWFASVLYQQERGLAFGHFPLGLGILVGQAILWTGVVTLAIGRVVLVLDTGSGTGEYRVRSPIVDAGEPCAFKLEDIQDIFIETAREIQPRGPDRIERQVTVHRLRLRLSNPRRAITLDETQNDRLVRLQKLADRVAGFLGRTPTYSQPSQRDSNGRASN